MSFELAKVEQWNLGLSAGVVAASYAFASPHFATSLAAGAFLEAINLGAIHRAAKRLFAGELMSAGWVGGLAIRFLILGTAIYLTMTAGANPIALLIGLSIAMPATLIDAWLNRPPVLDPSTLPVFLDDGIDEGEENRLVQMGRLFTSRYSDNPDADWDADFYAAPDHEGSASAVTKEADSSSPRTESDDFEERNR